jgi:hypothetical protein
MRQKRLHTRNGYVTPAFPDWFLLQKISLFSFKYCSIKYILLASIIFNSVSICRRVAMYLRFMILKWHHQRLWILALISRLHFHARACHHLYECIIAASVNILAFQSTDGTRLLLGVTWTELIWRSITSHLSTELSYFTALTGIISGLQRITLSGWWTDFKRKMSYSPLSKGYLTAASEVRGMCKDTKTETQSALELVLVTLGLTKFVAVVVAVVLSLQVFFLPDTTQSMSPRSNFRGVVLRE